MNKLLPLSKMLLVLFFCSTFLNAQVVDLNGNSLIISADTMLGGKFINVATFSILQGVTVTVDSTKFFLEIEADKIFLSGTINGSGRGAIGGSGGNGGSYSNGSGNPGRGGLGGFSGSGLGGGQPGFAGGDGGFITQICGGFLCSGNRDGLNGGGGGAGGGSGGSYGGSGGSGGWGAYGTGFTGASGGVYGGGGLVSAVYGNNTDFDINFGSGGAGAGGGGGGWSAGGFGGKGGNGGAMVSLYASDTIIIYASGKILCNATNGGVGGTGAGESTGNTYTCSSSAYSSCTLCSESVFDGPGGAAGGAGGGSGGGIRIHSPGTMKLFSGSQLSVNGGNGGSNGYPNSSVGTCFDNAANGGGGGGGRIKVITNCHPDNLYDMTFTTNGGVGFQSGNSGTFDLLPLMPENAGIIYGDTVVCEGSVISYSIDDVDLASSYTWNIPSGAAILSGAGTDSITVQFNTVNSGLISVTPVNFCGNGDSSILNVQVNPLPVLSLITSVELHLCYGDSVTLLANSDTSLTYQWQIDSLCNNTWADIPGATTPSHYISNATQTYCYKLAVSNSCGTVVSAVIQAVVNPAPSTPSVYFNNSTLYSSASTGNQWYNSQGIIAGQQGQTYLNPPDENYYVIVTDAWGCSSLPSNIVTVNTVGIDDISDYGLNFYPNPNNGSFNISVPEGLYTLIISDLLGRVIYEKEIKSDGSLYEITIPDINKGVYLIQMNSPVSRFTSKLVVS
ncbi:MAG: T9SS type A sorting domain-containing protein [Bacteroidales bacterium]|nr:T9SS type A sorting domain-containing protein [Bacteroidales bacterium]